MQRTEDNYHGCHDQLSAVSAYKSHAASSKLKDNEQLYKRKNSFVAISSLSGLRLKLQQGQSLKTFGEFLHSMLSNSGNSVTGGFVFC